MNSLWSSRTLGDVLSTPKMPEGDEAGNAQDTRSDAAIEAKSVNAPARPPLQRIQPSQPPPSAPPAPSFAPPPSPAGNNHQPGPNTTGQGQNPPDSLSLAQLRRIVAEFPRTEPIAYDYVYSDMGPIEEEVDEWFMYNFWQWVRLNAANRAFHSAWGRAFGQDFGWEDVSNDARRRFIKTALASLRSQDKSARGEAVGTLVYLVLGRWTETVRSATVPSLRNSKMRSAATKVQLIAMKEGVKLLADCGGLPLVWDALRDAFEPFWYVWFFQRCETLC